MKRTLRSTRSTRSTRSCGFRVALSWLVFLTACGTGRDVDVGRLTLRGSTAAGGQPGSLACDTAPCGSHMGAQLFVQDGATDADADAFATATSHPSGSDPSKEPVLLYPSDETRLPLNLTLLRFAWQPQGNNRFALDFTGPQTSVRIVSASTSFTPSAEQWDWIATSNRGARVRVVLRALDQNDASESWQASEVALDFAEEALDGTIYYWSTASGGLMQARLDDPVSVRVYPDPAGADAATCSGCHTVSRDGKRVALSSDKLELTELSLPGRSPILGGASAKAPMPAGMGPKPTPPVPASFSTFSPDGKLLLAASHGKLRLVDADTGAPLSDPMEVPLPPGTLATHPDWSPLGDTVALTLATKGGDKQTDGGSIALLPYNGDGTFGTLDVLVASQGGSDNNYFPSFSPDGRFIAFVSASGDSEDASSAKIRLIELASRNVIELDRLNQRVGAEDGLLNLGNSMPSWAPASGGTYWLAFSSVRAYSDLRPADVKKDQLWIAAIDPSEPDPGSAAFWAPFQHIDQGNHRAFFTSSTPLTHCGDDCDARETCGDGIDNDCDCVVDDCSEELCDNGTDDDGDGRDDKSDPACVAPPP